jgi:LysM repeat protein
VPEDAAKSFYLVRAGDTACQIAERHNVSCRDLFRENKLNIDGDIFRGQRLKLPKEALQPVSVSEDSRWKVSGAAQVEQESALADAAQEQPNYFFTHHNFYVITRYNQSVLYAMAVHDLSAAIASMHNASILLQEKKSETPQ